MDRKRSASEASVDDANDTQDAPLNGSSSTMHHIEASKDNEWQEVAHRTKKRKINADAKKRQHSNPEVTFSPSKRLQAFLKIGDLQNLVLYIMADGTAPQWIAVRNRQEIRKTVVLLVPGLELGMFTGSTPLMSQLDSKTESRDSDEANKPKQRLPTHSSEERPEQPNKNHTSPDDYYPSKLDESRLNSSLRPLAKIFSLIWPIRVPGDEKYSKVYSPIYSMLSSSIPKTKEEKKAKGPAQVKANHWQNKRTPITSFLATLSDLETNDYVIHPVLYSSPKERSRLLDRRTRNNQTKEHGWVDSFVENVDDANVPDELIEQGSITAGRQVIAIDCEMVMTSEGGFELARISIVNWDGDVLLDELVKPKNPVNDYLTAYSGITKEMLDPVTMTLTDVQGKLLDLLTPKTIIVGHSLESDFNALKITHPFVLDTSLLYPHAKGPPLKQSLKWLTQRYLHRDIQKNDGSTGHDSIEDARACLDLVKQKCEKGPLWGIQGMTTEPLFKRLARSSRADSSQKDEGSHTPTRSAIVDWSDARHGYAVHVDVAVGCDSDGEVVDGVNKALQGDESTSNKGVDFVWARLRQLEIARRWSPPLSLGGEAEGFAGADNDDEPNVEQLTSAVAETVQNINKLYEALPPKTCFIVYSGTSDMRELIQLQAQQQQFRREYKIKKWDELTIRWTDAEEQAMRRACKRAREGIGFVVVKSDG
jgi:RNA exonuclease